jgi:hypothetical protein
VSNLVYPEDFSHIDASFRGIRFMTIVGINMLYFVDSSPPMP